MIRRCAILVTLWAIFNMAAVGNAENSNKCECAAFNVANADKITDLAPLIVQNPYNVTCNAVDAKNCEALCIELVKVGKEKAPEILCEKIGHAIALKPSLWSRICDGEWKFSGLSCEKVICCHDGKSIECEK